MSDDTGSQADARRGDLPKRFFTPQEQARIVEAIERAERLTSGEIRLHIERDVPGRAPAQGDPYLRGRELFARLGMHATAERNGVLVYLATRSRRLAIVGDEELHKRVGDAFWREIAAAMSAEFAAGRFAAGVVGGILAIGRQLQTHFPRRTDDVDELADEISFGAGETERDTDRPS
jgi:uncharacterized membrane protein